MEHDKGHSSDDRSPTWMPMPPKKRRRASKSPDRAHTPYPSRHGDAEAPPFDQLPDEVQLAIFDQLSTRREYEALHALCTSDRHLRSLCSDRPAPVYSPTGALIANVPRLFADMSDATCVMTGLLHGLAAYAVTTVNRATAAWRASRAHNPALAVYDHAYGYEIESPRALASVSSLSPRLLYLWASSPTMAHFVDGLAEHAVMSWPAYAVPAVMLLLDQAAAQVARGDTPERQLAYAWDIMAGNARFAARRMIGVITRGGTGSPPADEVMADVNHVERERYTIEALRALDHDAWGSMGIYAGPPQLPVGVGGFLWRLHINDTHDGEDADAMIQDRGDDTLEQATRILAVATTVRDASAMLGVDVGTRLDISPRAPSADIAKRLNAYEAEAYAAFAPLTEMSTLAHGVLRYASGDAQTRATISERARDLLGIGAKVRERAQKWLDREVWRHTPRDTTLRPPAWAGYNVPQRLDDFFSVDELWLLVSPTLGVVLCGRLTGIEPDKPAPGTPCTWRADQGRPWRPPY